MKKYTSFLFLSIIIYCLNTEIIASGKRVKPRVIATTDGEIDDRSSMVRFLIYSCDYDIAGIVQVASSYQPNGHSSEKWIEKQVDLYGLSLTNLRIHNPDYPDTALLKSVIKVGNETKTDLAKTPPDMSTKDTPGSQLIIDALLDSDPRPVHILHWGGAITTAYALYKIKNTYSKEKYDYAMSKARLYCIWYQDAGGKWIQNNIPEVKIYQAGGNGDADVMSWRYVWDYMSVDYYYKNRASKNPLEVQTYMNKTWTGTNIKTNHGELGKNYPQDYTSEGDSPSFLPLINNGLEQDQDYTLGGWGGRPHYDKGNHMADSPDDGNYNKTFWRWVIDAQNDFAAHMDWCVASSFNAANHQPLAIVAGSKIISVKPGSEVALDASPSTDPDGNSISYNWWQYYDADNASAKVNINNNTSAKASMVIPDEDGKQLHIILEVTDNGTPALKSYQRVILNIDKTTRTPLLSSTDIRVFPNPVSDMCTITFGNEGSDGAIVQLFDNTGRLMICKKIISANCSINMSSMPSGIYIAKVLSSKGTVVKHVVKK